MAVLGTLNTGEFEYAAFELDLELLRDLLSAGAISKRQAVSISMRMVEVIIGLHTHGDPHASNWLVGDFSDAYKAHDDTFSEIVWEILFARRGYGKLWNGFELIDVNKPHDFHDKYYSIHSIASCSHRSPLAIISRA